MSSYNLEDVKGIGPVKLKTLRNAQIKSVEQLANSNINELIKLEGIGEKTAEKFINRAKSLLGKPIKSSSMVSKGRSRYSDSLINKVKSDISLLFQQIDVIKNRLAKIENKMDISQRVTDSKVSDEYFNRVLKSVYNSLPKKLGDFVPISNLTENIKQYIPWSTGKIHQKIYSLFMNYKVELQPGKADYGKPLIQDGKKFVWFKLK